MSYAAELARLVVRYEPADREALRAFQREHFGADSRQSNDGFFEWLFERNPHRDPAGASVWLVKRDGIVVAQQASIPIVLKVGDAEHRAAWQIDWMVHPDWRLKGVSPALLAANEASTGIMLVLGIEDVAYRSVLRAGWKDAGRLSLFVRPLEPEACARILNLPRMLAKLAPRFVVGGSAHVVGRVAGALSGVSLEPTPAFDERIDGVWRAVCSEYPVLAKRDFQTVRWRFDEGPHRTLFDRYYVKRKGQVIGYAVMRVTEWRGHRIGRVVDYLVEPRALAPLLALLIDEASTKGAVAVFFEQWHTRSEKILRALGCVRARLSHRVLFKTRDTASPVAATLAQAENWFVMPADSDFDHALVGTQDGSESEPSR